MPLRKRSSKARKRRRIPRGARLKAPLRVAYEVGAILVEIVRIPIGFWLRFAELAGGVVLAAWRAGRPLLAAIGRAILRLVAWASRVVTPVRASVVVALIAVIALAASQFVDYRAVQIGAPQYRHVGSVAPPPAVDAADPRSAHGSWVLIIDAIALGVICLAAATRRWRYARLLVPLGAAVVVIAIAGDAPQGLETGQAGIAYEGARATLLDGFGAEIAAACVLTLSGVLLSMYAPARGRTKSRRSLRLGRRRAKRRSASAPGRSEPVRAGTPRKASG